MGLAALIYTFGMWVTTVFVTKGESMNGLDILCGLFWPAIFTTVLVIYLIELFDNLI